jgi:hypothetical protein
VANEGPGGRRGGNRRAGIGAISALAAVVVLVPGLVVYSLLRGLGLAIGPAGVVGLFVMILGMVAYPMILRRTGWVDPPPPQQRSGPRPDVPGASEPVVRPDDREDRP